MAKKFKPSSSVSFHDTPDEGRESKYKEIIAKAKAGSQERPGPMSGTPRFDEVNSSWEKPEYPNQISETTADGLEALAAAEQEAEYVANEEAKQLESGLPYAPQSVDIGKLAEDEEKEELSEDEKIKKAISSRVSEIDIGQYLMNGELTQRVPIIPGKLEITFRTVTDLEECFVDDKLSTEGELTARAFLRRANEWALAFHISEVNGHKWPTTIDGDGTISEKSINRRLAHVKKLSSPIFHLLSQNLAWFLERVSTSLNMETLGNG